MRMGKQHRRVLKPDSGTRQRIFRACTRVFISLVGFWFFTVCLYRFVAPPATSLVLIRGVEYLLQGKPLVKGWVWKPLEEIPLHVRRAVVTAEDARFMEHWGLDIVQIGKAWQGTSRKSGARGASTITMQTVKNLFLWPSRSYIRKGFEVLMTPVAGIIWGKRRTLELYLNIIEWGEGIYGIEAAAQHYFRCSASALTTHQAAVLASILPNPRRLSPIKLSKASRRTIARVLAEVRSTRVPL